MDCYIGMIMYFAGNYQIENFLPCDGRALRCQEYQALFAVIGTLYGGDYSKGVFNIPKMEKVGGVMPMICVTGVFPSHY